MTIAPFHHAGRIVDIETDVLLYFHFLFLACSSENVHLLFLNSLFVSFYWESLQDFVKLLK